MAFKEVNHGDFDFNSFVKIEDWALVTAGTVESHNMLTVTGCMCGQLWLRKMIQVYVHPDRHTYGFMEANPYFTVSLFDTPRHPALQVCGRMSGRDHDKTKEAGLTPIAYKNTVVFEQAQTVFVCRKVYHADVTRENFDDQNVFADYYKTSKTFHRMYWGEVEAVLRHV